MFLPQSSSKERNSTVYVSKANAVNKKYSKKKTLNKNYEDKKGRLKSRIWIDRQLSKSVQKITLSQKELMIIS